MYRRTEHFTSLSIWTGKKLKHSHILSNDNLNHTQAKNQKKTRNFEYTTSAFFEWQKKVINRVYMDYITILIMHDRPKAICSILLTWVEKTTSTPTSARSRLEIVAIAASPNWDRGCLSSTAPSPYRIPQVRIMIMEIGSY